MPCAVFDAAATPRFNVLVLGNLHFESSHSVSTQYAVSSIADIGDRGGEWYFTGDDGHNPMYCHRELIENAEIVIVARDFPRLAVCHALNFCAGSIVLWDGGGFPDDQTGASMYWCSQHYPTCGFEVFGANAVVTYAASSSADTVTAARAVARLLEDPPLRFVAVARLVVGDPSLPPPPSAYYVCCRGDQMRVFEHDVWIVGADLSGVRSRWLEERAFSGCARLVGVRLPADMVDIGDQCFECASRLLNLGDSHLWVQIGAEAFLGCGALSFTGGPELGFIGDFAFCFSSVAKVALAGSASRLSVGKRAFMGCRDLRKVTIGGSAWLDSEAFGCVILDQLCLSSGVKVDEAAFVGARVGIVEYDGTLEEYRAFLRTELRLPPTQTCFVSVGGLERHTVVWSENDLPVLEQPGKTKQMDLRSDNRRIILHLTRGSVDFFGCHALVEVDMSGMAKNAIPGRAFSSCGWLRFVLLPAQVRELGSECFAQCRRLATLAGVVRPVDVGGSAFEECCAMRQLGWDELIIRAGRDAFSWTSVERLRLSRGFGGDLDISSCLGLRELTLPYRWAGTLNAQRCVGLCSIEYGRAVLKTCGSFHLCVVRYKGRGVASDLTCEASFEFSRVFAACVQFHRNVTVAVLPP